MRTIDTLVAVEPGLDRQAVEATLPQEHGLRLVGVAEPGDDWELAARARPPTSSSWSRARSRR